MTMDEQSRKITWLELAVLRIKQQLERERAAAAGLVEALARIESECCRHDTTATGIATRALENHEAAIKDGGA